jgi:undecaprenyl diphosphate synthase
MNTTREKAPIGTVSSRSQDVPQHLAIIMDGNGRWATSQGLPRLQGHRAGVENVRRTLKSVVARGISILTLYAFSTENWSRPEAEVQGLLALIDHSLQRELPELNRQGVRLQHIGELTGLRSGTRKKVKQAIQQTRSNQRLVLNLAFNYGGRAEIMQAIRRIMLEEINHEQVDEKMLSNYLYTAGQPDPDLIIRTGGELRLSNFLLWQAAYAELYSTDTYWPDFDANELQRALDQYSTRERRYGKV